MTQDTKEEKVKTKQADGNRSAAQATAQDSHQ